MKAVKAVAVALSSLALSGVANAALFHFDGNIEYHNDVVYTYFTLNQDATDVSIWTDSFLSATNFDPITALWHADGSKIAENDDNAGIAPGQTYYDSGIELSSLAAGDYVFTIATYANFSLSSNFNDGFIYDSEVPVALADWDQPANHEGMGTYWSLWLDGVDSASNPDATVPEPATLGLLGLGFAGLLLSRRKKA